MERSYWQPQPANGFVTINLTPPDTGSASASMGTQSIAPGGFVREHSHVDQEEIIYVLEGTGTAVVDGVRHDMAPGTAFFLGRGVRHSFINEGVDSLLYTWTIIPGHGLHEFFASIGRPRIPGEPPPQPFARPADVAAIEAQTGFSSAGS
ncbi:MAG: cupin domain-containing protein [Burkholderiaceae bacterium]